MGINMFIRDMNDIQLCCIKNDYIFIKFIDFIRNLLFLNPDIGSFFSVFKNINHKLTLSRKNINCDFILELMDKISNFKDATIDKINLDVVINKYTLDNLDIKFILNKFIDDADIVNLFKSIDYYISINKIIINDTYLLNLLRQEYLYGDCNFKYFQRLKMFIDNIIIK